MSPRKKRPLKITIHPFAAALEETINTRARMEKGLPLSPEATDVNFCDATRMMSTLSEMRMELLLFLHAEGPMNIRQLALNLDRDYSVVHGDVQTLLRLGLLSLNAEKQVFVPWDEISFELSLMV